jgi:uncharacterized damage-inducible protein DinB
MTDSAERSTYLEALRQFPDQLNALVSGLSAEQLTTAFQPGEWTVAQNVHHVADTHMIFITRIKHLLTTDTPRFVAFDQDVWAQQPDSTQADVAASIGILRGVHQHLTILFEQASTEDWARSGIHPHRGEVTLADLLRLTVAHGNAHLQQITETLAAGGL